MVQPSSRGRQGCLLPTHALRFDHLRRKADRTSPGKLQTSKKQFVWSLGTGILQTTEQHQSYALNIIDLRDDQPRVFAED